MKKKNAARFILPAFCLICLLTAAFFIYKASALGGLATQKQASLAQMETFLQSGQTESFTNNDAIEKFGKQAAVEIKNTNMAAAYQAPEGFLMKSYSDAWDEPKLKLLREELLKNKHGKELDFLSEIRVYPDGEERYLATHNTDEKTTRFKVEFPAMPKYFEIEFHRQVGIICLYGGEKNTTVESMAKSLSHEYGHHFTFYHMFEGRDLADSEYAKLRKLPTDKTITLATPDASDYLQEHHWYLFEIAAEDYVSLMGSPTIKRICEVKDSKQLLAGAKEPDEREFYQCANVDPQENLMIPLANDVKGLGEYFYSFIEEEFPAPKSPKKEMKINVEKGYQSYHLVGGRKTFTYYKVTWDTPYEDPEAVYTLIRFGEYDDAYYTLPVKTVHSGDSAIAYVGDVTRTSGNNVYYYKDKLTTGTQYFVVSVQLSDGTVYLSDPLAYKFS